MVQKFRCTQGKRKQLSTGGSLCNMEEKRLPEKAQRKLPEPGASRSLRLAAPSSVPSQPHSVSPISPEGRYGAVIAREAFIYLLAFHVGLCFCISPQATARLDASDCSYYSNFNKICLSC